jgi:uncharacterized protein (DUF1501 family)
MLTRREILIRSLQTSSLVALGRVVPGFLADAARAAEPGKDTVLVVLELTGGNDGLNTVIPYADDLYYKARPTLAYKKDQVLRVDDHVGLHPGLRGLDPLLKSGGLAAVLGVGYPNPNRSHFESMDVWQSADPTGGRKTGWLNRGAVELQAQGGGVPALQVGPEKLPLALRGPASGVASLNGGQPFALKVGGTPDERPERQKLFDDLAKMSEPPAGDGLLPFVQGRQLETYSTVEQLREALAKVAPNGQLSTALGQKLGLVAQLIDKGLGTRVFYVAQDGFDTHSGQAPVHQKLLEELAGAVQALFAALRPGGHDKRVVVMTFSEFGRRVQENGSRGTDHGAGSCLFVAGPAIKGGAVGKHPSLANLDNGDLRHHTDFRSVYATLLDGWLGCESKAVLGEKFDPLPLLKGQS